MNSLTRRNFLKGAGAAGLLLATPLASAVTRTPATGERSLRFLNLHTGERLTATFWADGQYINEELAAIDHLLRDHRRNEASHMDNGLLEQLYTLQQRLEKPDATINVISGYRSPQTNAQLRNNSSGVAKRSLHMQGRAIDLRIPGVELNHLRKAALDMKAGGVGYYPDSNFVHLDTGRHRFW